MGGGWIYIQLQFIPDDSQVSLNIYFLSYLIIYLKIRQLKEIAVENTEKILLIFVWLLMIFAREASTTIL